MIPGEPCHHYEDVKDVEQRRRPAGGDPISVPRRTIGRKMAAVDANAMPADAKLSSESLETVHASAASAMPMAVGMHDWKTIAPVMLPIASVSLVWRTQIRLLNFSGSSVAMGAMISASSAGSRPGRLRDVLDGVDEDEGAADDHAPAPRAPAG